MKKVTAILLITIMALALLTGCGEKTVKQDISPYDTLNYDEYLKLADYSEYTCVPEKVEVTESDIETEIKNRLDAAAKETEVTEGTVDKGDKVKISFKGTLEDGSSPEGMNSDGYDLVLGEASMIEGFQEGLYGAKIGEPVTLDLKFPDPYENNPDLAGKNVTFEVTVLSKTETVTQELNEEFIKSDSQEKAATEAEYRDFIKAELQDAKNEEAVYAAKTELYRKIADNSEVTNAPEEEVDAALEVLKEQYKNYIESNGANFDEVVESLGGEEEYLKNLRELAESQVKQRILIFGLYQKEGLSMTDKEYTDEVMKYVTAAGASSIEELEEQSGMTIDGFLDMYNLKAEIYLTKVLDKIYDDLNPSEEAEEETQE